MRLITENVVLFLLNKIWKVKKLYDFLECPWLIVLKFYFMGRFNTRKAKHSLVMALVYIGLRLSNWLQSGSACTPKVGSSNEHLLCVVWPCPGSASSSWVCCWSPSKHTTTKERRATSPSTRDPSWNSTITLRDFSLRSLPTTSNGT